MHLMTGVSGICRSRKTICVFVLLLAGFCGAAFAQQPTFHDPLADKLTGDWVLTGTIGGKQTTHDIHAEWVLKHQFVLLHEISREKDNHNQPQYEALIYVGWDEVTKQYCVIWIDVWGGASVQTIGYAKPSGKSMPFLFKGPDDVFHTTFTYDDASDIWTWQMDSEKDGKFSPFARVNLTRAQH
jgi:hypothetical protein